MILFPYVDARVTKTTLALSAASMPIRKDPRGQIAIEELETAACPSHPNSLLLSCWRGRACNVVELSLQRHVVKSVERNGEEKADSPVQ